MKTNITRWTNPVLGQQTEVTYGNIYGENGKDIIEVLETAPYEIAVISRLIAYLYSKKGGNAKDGHVKSS